MGALLEGHLLLVELWATCPPWGWPRARELGEPGWGEVRLNEPKV